ncbi:flagellar biosynthesis protein FlhF [Algiphilus sp.]|uniref:flagellar biosynthesis protein FlhF n=1 Tax=Algiphilus sp. TaxID=1872431 RepID=UPI002A63838D|nr:flagellar biosynthesis protein FlhF [Pseudomonadota bacterium]
MKIKRYFAPTMREAMRRVREEQGADAVILGSESRDGGIEVVAAVDYDEALLQQAVRREPSRRLSEAPLPPITEDDARSTPTSESRPPATPAAATDAPPSRRGQLIWAQDPQLKRLQEEMQGVRRMLSETLSQQTEAALRAHPQRARAMRSLEALGIDHELARELAAHVPDGDPAKHRNLPLSLLAKRLKTANPLQLARATRLALVGPTGAGKTTTLAKLAAKAVAEVGARNVALITMDGHRAGAEAQIGVYARLLGVSLRVVRDIKELRAALLACADCSHVFVDTAGLGPNDQRLARLLPELARLGNDPDIALRSLLVLPANVQRDDLISASARFAPARPMAVALTKVDESTRLGPAISALIGCGLPLAWLADGQGVPRDIHRARAGDVVMRAVWHARDARQRESTLERSQESAHA